MTALYVLANEYKQAAIALADLDMTPEAVTDTLDGLVGEFEVKATNVAMFVRNLEATAAQIKEAEDQMAKRRKSIEKRAENIAAYLKMNMESSGITEIDSPYFKLSIRNNPPKVVIDAESLIPSDYMTKPVAPPPVPNKTLIAMALKDGHEVPGAHLESGTRLEIK